MFSYGTVFCCILLSESCCTVCVVCQLPDVDSNQCACCMKPVHAEECSIHKEHNGKNGLVCKNCFCLLCKGSFNTDHICHCHVCRLPASLQEGVICYRCEKIMHPDNCSKSIRAKEKMNEPRFICQHCLYALSKLLHLMLLVLLLSFITL